MYLLGKVSDSLAEKISAELGYNQDKKEVIAYGAFAIMQISLSILFVIIFGLIFGVLAEALIVSFSGAILRRYTGGAHASSPNICIIIGTIVCVGFALISRLPVFSNVWVTGSLALAAGLSAFWLIHRLAPVANPNKPISDKRRPKMKRGGMVLNAVYLLINIGLCVASIVWNRPEWLAFAACIIFGVLWQIFSITHIGEVWLGALDGLLSFNKARQKKAD